MILFVDVLFALLLATSIYLLVRNQFVFKYRMGMLDTIRPGDEDFNLAIAAFDSVSYNKMVMGFKPLASYYRGTYLARRVVSGPGNPTFDRALNTLLPDN